MPHTIEMHPAAMFRTVWRQWLPALTAMLAMYLDIHSVQADMLYVTSLDNNTIVSFDTTANPPTPTTFASTGLNHPYFLAFDASGNLYAANSGNNTIERFTPGGVGSVFASTGLSFPTGLAFDAAGNLYVANTNSNTIEKFTPGGVGSLFASIGGPNHPGGLAVDAAGNLYVAVGNGGDPGTVEKFTPGGVGSVFASLGTPVTNLAGLAFDSAGNLFVSLNNNTIERFTPGGLGSVFASTGLNEPYGMAFDAAGNLYMANLNDNTIERFTSGGVGSVFTTNVSTPLGLAVRESTVPEPSTLVLMVLGGLGIAGWGLLRRGVVLRRRKDVPDRAWALI